MQDCEDGCDCTIDKDEIEQTEKDLHEELKRREAESNFFNQNKNKGPISPTVKPPLYRDEYEPFQYNKHNQRLDAQNEYQYKTGKMKENVNRINQ